MPNFSDHRISELYDALTARTELLPQVDDPEALNELVLHVAEGCNLGCTYCFADAGQYGRTVAKWMDPAAVRGFVDGVLRKKNRIDNIKFFGGEPLMNLPAIHAGIEALNEAVVEGRLQARPRYGCVSNMTITTSRVIDLVNTHDFYITGSIDGPEDVHDKFRTYSNGKGSWKVVDRGIKKLKAETGQPGSLEAVYGPEHVRLGYSLIDIHEYLEQYGPEYIIIHVMAQEPSVSDADGWPEFNEAIRDLSRDYGKYLVENISSSSCTQPVRDVLKSMATSGRSDAHCTLGMSTQTVTADGKLYPCYTLIERDEWVMQEDVTSSDDGSSYRRIQLKLIDNRKSTNSTCADCDIMTTCQACPGMWLQVNGDLAAPEPSHCLNQIGMIEGMLEQLIASKRDQPAWRLLSGALAARV
ncbi:radical SAM protein [Amycolatopsis lexingtonensis]|uniref:radical SAM protein n=1 Tax=Amycolatopsis lexingtonensis TaxID=218822 RepID=UPI003F72EC30